MGAHTPVHSQERLPGHSAGSAPTRHLSTQSGPEWEGRLGEQGCAGAPRKGSPALPSSSEKRPRTTCTKCPAALTFVARGWGPSPNPERLLPAYKVALGRQPGSPPRSVTRSEDRSPRATAPREGAARRMVPSRGIRKEVQAPPGRASGKPCPALGLHLPSVLGSSQGSPLLARGLRAGCRRQEATDTLQGQCNPRSP